MTLLTMKLMLVLVSKGGAHHDGVDIDAMTTIRSMA